MALVGNISGSSSSNSNIALSGSVVIANRPDSLFPTLSSVGGDVVFFVSGTRGGKGNSAERTVSVFGGDAVVSGSLTIGTGSVTITSNDITFQGGVAKIFSGSDGLTFEDSSGTRTLAQLIAGGGGGGGFFTESADKVIYNSGSVAFTGDRTGETITAASQKGGDVQFYFSGSTAAGSDARVALFGGGLVSSGTIRATDGTSAATMTAGGVISGSSDLQAGGNLTVAGTSTLVGDVTLTGNIRINGNDIKSSTGATAITLSNDGVIIAGDLTINGTTTTIDSTTVSIQDPVIGLGFSSGSATRGSPGDRGFIGGLDGENNVAMVWDESNDGFAVFRTTSSTTSSLPLDIVDYSTFRAGRVQLGGTGAFVTSSDGLNLTAQSSAQLALTGSTLVTIGTNGGTGQNVVFNFGHNQTRASLAWQPANTLVSFGGADGIGLQLSSSAGNLRFRHAGANVAGFYIDTAANPYASLAFASNITRFESASPRVEFGNSNNGITVLSGSTTIVNHGVGKLTVQKDGTQYLGIDYSVGASTAAISGSASQNLVVASGLGSTVLTLSGSSVTTNAGVVNFQRNGTTIAFVGTSPDANPLTGLFPSSDVTYNLGSPARRWANIYTGDLHLRNDRGDYTLIEEEDFLTIRFNKTGKRYKFLLEPVPEFDES